MQTPTQTQPDPKFPDCTSDFRQMFRVLREIYAASQHNDTPADLLLAACKEDIRGFVKSGGFSKNITAEAECRAIRLIADMMEKPYLQPKMQDYFDFPAHTWIASVIVQTRGDHVLKVWADAGFTITPQP